MTDIKNIGLNSIIIILMLVFSNPAISEEGDNTQDAKPQSGELVLPDDYNERDQKKCLTVCERWGEDCIINPGTGSRKCRRVCKSFAEECF